MRNPGQYGGGRQQPRDRLARLLLKSGLRRGCLCHYRENHTCTRQKPETNNMGKDVPSPSLELGVLDPPLCSVTPGDFPLHP